MAAVTVDALVVETGVQDLNQEIQPSDDDDDLLELSKICVDWELVGEHLKLDIRAIDEENKSVEMKRLRVLQKWKESRAFNATYKVLVEVLLACKKVQQAREVCRFLAKKQGTSYPPY